MRQIKEGRKIDKERGRIEKKKASKEGSTDITPNVGIKIDKICERNP